MKIKTIEDRGQIQIVKIREIMVEDSDRYVRDNVQMDIEWVGPEPTKATMTIAQAMDTIAQQEARNIENGWLSWAHVAESAVRMVVADHNKR